LQQLARKQQVFKTYQDGINFLENDFYYHYGSLSHYLDENGHETALIVPNFVALQKLWCQENQIKDRYELAIVEAQIQTFKPDIVFLNSNFEYYPILIPFLKKHHIKICAWISCPFPNDLDLTQIDHVFTLFEPHFQTFTARGIPTTLTHGGFDERILNQVIKKSYYPVSFVGGIGKAHQKRETFLKKIVKVLPLSIWGYGFVSAKKWKTIAKQFQQNFAFKKAFKGETWGIEMFNILSQSDITLNYHGDLAIGHSVNMRLFEATGVGTLLLTEENSGINQFFIPGKEVVVYNSPEDAIEKINYYLANPEEASKIAQAGQARTLKDYNYKHMIQQYIAVFEQLLMADEK
jgi:spore maturation protein CgeB